MKTWICLLLTGAGFVADRSTKLYAEKKLPETGKMLSFGGIRLKKVTNRGFMMSTMSDRRRLIVGVSSAVFLILTVAYAVVLHNPGYKPLRLGFSLIMGGAAGNTYDRLFRDGVTDFIEVPIFKRIVFNIADVCIVVGGLLAMLGELRIK